MTDYLSAAILMTERLSLKLTIPSANIRQAISLEWAINNQLSPSVNIIYFDDVPDAGPGGSARSGRSQASDQYWLLLVSQRNVEGSGNSADMAAGVLVKDVLTALLGYELSPGHGKLHWQKCPYRKTDRNGYAHFPLLFSTRIVTTGTR